MLESIKKLIKVKTIVTFCVLAVWAVLSLTGKIEPDSVGSVTLMVISFYFGTQHEKDSGAQS